MPKKQTITWSVKVWLQIVYNMSRIYVGRFQCRQKIVDECCEIIFTDKLCKDITYIQMYLFFRMRRAMTFCVLGHLDSDNSKGKEKREKKKGTTKVS